MEKHVRNKRISARLVLGIILILISVSGVTLLVRAASSTVGVLVAAHLLVEGQQVTSADLKERQVQIDEISAGYVRDAQFAVGKVITRSIHEGELIPRASLGDPAGVIETSLVIEVDVPLASRVVPGSRVDIWATDKPTGSASATDPEAPSSHLLVSGARLAAHSANSGALGEGTERVELVVDRQQIPLVLDAQAQGLALHVLASSGGL